MVLKIIFELIELVIRSAVIAVLMTGLCISIALGLVKLIHRFHRQH